MNTDTVSQFKTELNSFFVLVLLNMVFGALTMAFGIQYMVTSVMGLSSGHTGTVFRIFAGTLSLVCFGIGLAWVLASARILKGITAVRREYNKCPEPVPAEILTGWIVRIMTHYRKNKETIRWMTLICALGGCIFLVLGILNIVQGIAALSGSGGPEMGVLAFVAAGINLTIGCSSLLFASWFKKYTEVWDHRMDEAARSEDALRLALEQH
jgi:hypothetical protein